ncbi:MAG: adenylyl-sulfate reductase subunit alpha, partial [Nitrospirota bacterium]
MQRVEGWGLPIPKDQMGRPVPRGRWNIKIYGEALKQILSAAVQNAGVDVINRVNVTNLILDDNRVKGVIGFGVRDGKLYVISAKATIVATGGCSGIYRPNNDGTAHHKIWYPPFNTGAGYAMGIRAGAEMTSFEMRFIALRTKDAIAPTGTLALGFGAPQVNSKGEQFMKVRYADWGGEGAPTTIRVYAPTMESKEGRGPCFLDTTHLTKEKVRELKSSYLDMYPNIVLYWAANGIDPSKEPVEIEGTEPYIIGGHCQSGYWIDADRKTTLEGLYAAGDVAGGAPYKFVSGCWAEGLIAARAAVNWINNKVLSPITEWEIGREEERVFAPINRMEKEKDGVRPKEMEERLQKIMDEYAGGVRTYYEMNEERLRVAASKLKTLRGQIQFLIAGDMHELMLAHEVVDRIDVADVLVQHLIFRKETRWPGFQTRLDYPKRDDENWLKFVNSKRNMETGEIVVFTRPYYQLVPGDRYKPK